MPIRFFAHLGVHHATKFQAAIHQLQQAFVGLVLVIVISILMLLTIAWLINRTRPVPHRQDSARKEPRNPS